MKVIPFHLLAPTSPLSYLPCLGWQIEHDPETSCWPEKITFPGLNLQVEFLKPTEK